MNYRKFIESTLMVDDMIVNRPSLFYYTSRVDDILQNGLVIDQSTLHYLFYFNRLTDKHLHDISRNSLSSVDFSCVKIPLHHIPKSIINYLIPRLYFYKNYLNGTRTSIQRLIEIYDYKYIVEHSSDEYDLDEIPHIELITERLSVTIPPLCFRKVN